MKIQKLLLCLTSLVLLNCASKPVAPAETGITEGTWNTRAFIQDKKNGRNQALVIDFVGLRANQQLRAEIAAGFGVSVASLALNGEQAQLAVHTQKRFYSGRASEKVLQSLAGVKVDPRILIYVLFDQPIPGWDCQRGEDGLPSACQNSAGDFKVTWSERNGPLKRITLIKPEFDIQVVVKTFSPKVQVKESLFSLQAPETYKSYHLN